MDNQGSSKPYAGFLPRLGAFGLDYLPIAGYLLLILAGGMTANHLSPTIRQNGITTPMAGEALGFLLVTLPVSLYFALSESSPRQATWGKRKAGLRVTDTRGRRLCKIRSLWRTAMKFLPWELAHNAIWQGSLGPGFDSPRFTASISLVWLLVGANILSMLLSSRRQTLYDRLAGTLVVRTSKNSNTTFF